MLLLERPLVRAKDARFGNAVHSALPRDVIVEDGPAVRRGLRLSKNHTLAPVSGKIGTGAMLWKNGKKTRDEM